MISLFLFFLYHPYFDINSLEIMAVCFDHSIFAYGFNSKLVSIYILPCQEIANIKLFDFQYLLLNNLINF
jgi:hypothetical protein